MALGHVTSLALVRGMEQLLGVIITKLGAHRGTVCARGTVRSGHGGLCYARASAAPPGARRCPICWACKRRGSEGMRTRMARIGLALGGGLGRRHHGISWAAGCPWKFSELSLPCYLALVLVSGVSADADVFSLSLALVAWLLRPLWGIEGRLAARQLERNSLRSGLTAAVLCVALVISIAMGQSLRNNIDDIEEWSVRTFTADYLVRGTLPELSYAIGTHLPEELHDELAQLDGVANVNELNLVQAKAGDEAIVVLARSFDDAATLALDIADRKSRGHSPGPDGRAKP